MMLCPQHCQGGAHDLLSPLIPQHCWETHHLKMRPCNTELLACPSKPTTLQTWRTVACQGPLGRVAEMQFPFRVPQKKVIAPRVEPSSSQVGSWPGGSGMLAATARQVPSDGGLPPYQDPRGSVSKPGSGLHPRPC